MEILKPCSPVTCPMRAVTCNYLLDFNPKFDKIKTAWMRARKEAESRGRSAVVEVDRKFVALVSPLVAEDVKEGLAKCKADWESPFNESLSLEQIAQIFGITRPRVQQIEARAKKKIEEVKEELADLVQSPTENE
jgi:hypothetical protein